MHLCAGVTPRAHVPHLRFSTAGQRAVHRTGHRLKQELVLKIYLAVLTALSIALAGVPSVASAQDAYPQKLVKIIVGFPPGVPGDVLARMMAPKFAEGLGQPVIVENKPGGGSSIAAESIVKAEPDGYTIYMVTSANAVNQSVNKLSFDLAKDMALISIVADVPGLLVTHPSVPDNVRDLIAAAKAKPEALSYGSSGPGTQTHLYGELFNLTAGTKLAHIPYRGSSQTVTDLLAGRIQVMFTPGSTVIPHVKSGQIKALAAIGQNRLPTLTDVPTFTEVGLAGFESGFWFGLSAPPGTPKHIVERLNKETVRVLGMPDVREKLIAQGIDPMSSSAEAFGDFVRRDLEKWARVAKAAGLQQ
jgi:tripartite-type tricarboxylate transporter receptor subunit TctC